VYSTGLALITFQVFEGVFLEGKEGEAAASAEFNGAKVVVVKVIQSQGSFEGGSCGVATLGCFFHNAERRHSLTLVGAEHAIAREIPFIKHFTHCFQGDGAAHGIQIRTGH
jgi:hypothetical protein